MKKPEIMIVSPHRDDAAFSCGIAMSAILAEANITVVNVFTKSAYAPFALEIEQVGVDAVSDLRYREDCFMIDALRRILPAATDASSGHIAEVSLGLLDAPLRLTLDLSQTQGPTSAYNDLEPEILALSRVLSPVVSTASYVLLPLGLGGTGLEGHIDHRITRDAGMRCSALDRIAFYEDLPYAARMEKPLLSSAISSFHPVAHGLAWPCKVTHADGVSIKATLARKYHSQVEDATVLEMCNYAEERGGGEVVYAGAKVWSFLVAVTSKLIPMAGAQ